MNRAVYACIAACALAVVPVLSHAAPVFGTINSSSSLPPAGWSEYGASGNPSPGVIANPDYTKPGESSSSEGAMSYLGEDVLSIERAKTKGPHGYQQSLYDPDTNTNYTHVTLESEFRVRFTNNTVGNRGDAILELGVLGGPTLAITANDKDYPSIADHYWFRLIQYSTSAGVVSTQEIMPFPLVPGSTPTSGESYQESNFHSAKIELNGPHALVWWDGTLILDRVFTEGLNTAGGNVAFGVGTPVNNVGGANGTNYFRSVTLVPEPGSMLTLGAGVLGLLSALRRRR
ncbi:MAG: PEP-CTERM sorting domain-containing protein [Armatimonadetes bacterium]|nr:PEP-CTERM sorting domain-containing protein [Armatimonadota bacterium]